jgi:hypothetical protein
VPFLTIIAMHVVLVTIAAYIVCKRSHSSKESLRSMSRTSISDIVFAVSEHKDLSEYHSLQA